MSDMSFDTRDMHSSSSVGGCEADRSQISGKRSNLGNFRISAHLCTPIRWSEVETMLILEERCREEEAVTPRKRRPDPAVDVAKAKLKEERAKVEACSPVMQHDAGNLLKTGEKQSNT